MSRKQSELESKPGNPKRSFKLHPYYDRDGLAGLQQHATSRLVNQQPSSQTLLMAGSSNTQQASWGWVRHRDTRGGADRAGAFTMRSWGQERAKSRVEEQGH